MSPLDLKKLVIEVELIAREAGQVILASPRSVRKKPDGTDVTPADLASEQVILAALKRLTPNIPIISEETGADNEVPKNGTFWTVDPLDGTTDFISGLPGWGVAIALIDAGRAVLGVIDHPALGWTYSGCGPGTASKLDANGVRSVVPSDAARAAKAPHRILTTRYLARDKVRPYVIKAFGHEDGMIEAGEGVFGACQIADRMADWCPVWLNNRDDGRSLWLDVAPGHAIVEAAGCIIETFDGQPITYRDADRRVPPHVIYPA